MAAVRTVAGACLGLATLAACGGEGAIGSDGGPADGGVDSPPGCVLAVQFTPATPVAPAVVVAEADALGGSGILDYSWTVRRGGADLPFTTLDVMGRDIQFEATEPGIYAVSAFAGNCTPSFTELNVGTSGANQRPVRMRFVPPAGLGVPPQERVVTVPGGSDYSLGTVILDPGVVSPVSVRTVGAAPVAAYLRFSSRTTPDAAVEAWSDAAGSAQVRLASGHHDVLVVPTANLAPALISDWDPASGQLTIDGGTAWTGTVVDSAGAAIAGARVSLTSGGVPSTVATTDAAGHFDVRWRDAVGRERIVVVPPTGRGLPRLDFDLAVPAATTTIRYAALVGRALAGAQIQVGGAPAAAVDVAVVQSLVAAATVEVPAAAPVSVAGGQRLLLHTDGDGRLPAATALAAPAELFVAVAGGGARGTVDLGPGVGAVLPAAPAVTVTGRVVDSVGAAVTGARVRATLDDALAYAGAPIATTATDASGGFTLALAPGQRYAVTVVDPTARRAATRTTVTRAAGGALPDLVLGKALRVSGEVRATGVGAPLRAVGIAALCQLGCAGLERDRPLGDAVTDAAGRFAVAVPDPGVGQ